jgi:hypothetical protein
MGAFEFSLRLFEIFTIAQGCADIFDHRFLSRINICIVQALPPSYLAAHSLKGLGTNFDISMELISGHSADFEGSP